MKPLIHNLKNIVTVTMLPEKTELVWIPKQAFYDYVLPTSPLL